MTDEERANLLAALRSAVMAVQMPVSTILSERAEIRRKMLEAVKQAINTSAEPPA